ncbi:MAG: DUF58 domain-containing protein [Gammaproteobacteria bacterium]|jgi:uncharacterized protein (DUF58 family)|nr:DUF58 domain-containing protein [Gammaproteobacteria bacterium]
MPFSLVTLPHRLQRWLNIDRRGDRARLDEAVTLGYKRIFILPTPQGLLFGAMTVVMLIGAANYNNNLAFLLTFLLIATGLVGLVRTYQNIAGITLRPARCPPVFCGETARFDIAVDAGTQPRRAVGLRRGTAASAWFDSTARTITVEAPAENRGTLELGRLLVHTSYPLGLFRAKAYLHYHCAIIVYPRPAPARDPRRDNRHDQDPGANDFIGHRAWAAGDPPRHVDWKAAARSGVMLNKQFGGDDRAERWLDWDEHRGFSTEERLSRLCREVLEAEAAGLRYALRLPGTSIGPGTGGAQRNRCLRALALFGAA